MPIGQIIQLIQAPNWSAVKTVTKDDAGYFTIVTATSPFEPRVGLSFPTQTVYTSSDSIKISGWATYVEAPVLTSYHYGIVPVSSDVYYPSLNATGGFVQTVTVASGTNVIEVASQPLSISKKINIIRDSTPPRILSYVPADEVSNPIQQVSVDVCDNETGVILEGADIIIDGATTSELFIEPITAEYTACDHEDIFKITYYSDTEFTINASHTITFNVYDRAGNISTENWDFKTTTSESYEFAFKKGWNQFALPFYFLEQDITANDDFEPLRSTLFRYQGASPTAVYETGTSTNIESLMPHRGYVFFASNDVNIEFTNVTKETRAKWASVPINAGYNLVGPVLDGNPWHSVHVLKNDPETEILNTYQASRQGWIRDAAISYNTEEGFRIITTCGPNNTELASKNSYWIYSQISSIFLITGFNTGKEKCKRWGLDDWTYFIRAEYDDDSYGDEIQVGDYSGASDGVDHFDLTAPPKFPDIGESASISIRLTGISPTEKHIIDLRAPDSFGEDNRKVWDFEVVHNTELDNALVSLSFGKSITYRGYQDYPSTGTVYLIDYGKATDQYHFIQRSVSEQAYTYQIKNSTETRKFQLVYQKQETGFLHGRVILSGHTKINDDGKIIVQNENDGILIEVCETSGCDEGAVATGTPRSDGYYDIAGIPKGERRVSFTTPDPDTTGGYIREETDLKTFIETRHERVISFLENTSNTKCRVEIGEGYPLGRNIPCLNGGNPEVTATETRRVSLRNATGTLKTSPPDFWEYDAGTLATGTYVYDFDHVLWHYRERSATSTYNAWWATDTTAYSTNPVDFNRDGHVNMLDYNITRRVMNCNEDLCGEQCFLRDSAVRCGINNPSCANNFNCYMNGDEVRSWKDGDFNSDGKIDSIDYLDMKSCYGHSATGDCLVYDLDSSGVVDNNDQKMLFNLVYVCDETTCGERCLKARGIINSKCGINDSSCNNRCVTYDGATASWRIADITDTSGVAFATDGVISADDASFVRDQFDNVYWGNSTNYSDDYYNFLKYDIDGSGHINDVDLLVIGSGWMESTATIDFDTHCLIDPDSGYEGDPCLITDSNCNEYCARHYKNNDILLLADADFSDNGIINAFDLVQMKPYWLRGSLPTDRPGFKRVDWNIDNVVDTFDLPYFYKGFKRCEEIEGEMGIDSCMRCDESTATLLSSCE